MVNKMKKTLLLSLVVTIFTAQKSSAIDYPSNEAMGFVGGVVAIATAGGMLGKTTLEYFQSRITHAQNVAGGYLSNNEKELGLISSQLEIARKNSKKNARRIEVLEAMLEAYASFTKSGKTDQTNFRETPEFLAMQTKLEEEDKNIALKKDTANNVVASKPGFFKQTANALYTPIDLTIQATGSVAETLGINNALDRLTSYSYFKDGILYDNKRFFGNALVAMTTAIMTYKAYAWYTDEERLLAAQTVAELQMQAQELAQQYKEEMAKPTLSAEDKSKLERGYANYMKQLARDIQEQKIIAGYNVYKKLLIGAIVAAGGIAGLIHLNKLYPYQPEGAVSQPPVVTASPIVFTQATTPAAAQPTIESAQQPITLENLKVWAENPDLCTVTRDEKDAFFSKIDSFIESTEGSDWATAHNYGTLVVKEVNKRHPQGPSRLSQWWNAPSTEPTPNSTTENLHQEPIEQKSELSENNSLITKASNLISTADQYAKTAIDNNPNATTAFIVVGGAAGLGMLSHAAGY